VEAKFNFADSSKVLLEVFDLEVKELTYSIISDTVVTVTARAGNRAMPTGNLWFRIYPIYGGGSHEFPIAEMLIDTFETNQTISLSGVFKPPSLDKSVEFIAIIDDGHSIYEIIEVNNQLKTSFHQTAAEDLIAGNGGFMIYPNPVQDELYMNYSLDSHFDRVNMTIYDMEGKMCFQSTDYPAYAGKHQAVQRLDLLPNGIYIYRFVAIRKGEKPVQVTGRLVKE
jgi:hypothetical protein